MRRRVVCGVLVAAAATVTLAGCGGGSSGSSSKPAATGGPLLAALGQVRATTRTRAQFVYGDEAALRKANGGGYPTTGSLGRLGGYGWDELAPEAIRLPSVLGFDPRKADTVWLAGVAPHEVGRVNGPIDTAAVGRKLSALGAKRQGAVTWRLQPDYRVDVGGKLTRELSLTSQLNVVRVHSDHLVYAPAARLAADGEASGDGTLAENRGFAGVAGCLDRPLAAQLTADPHTVRSGYVVGVGARSASRAVLCVATPSPAAAKAEKARMVAALRGRDVVHNEPYASLLRDARVSVLGDGTVRLVARAQTTSALLFSMLDGRSLAPFWPTG